MADRDVWIDTDKIPSWSWDYLAQGTLDLLKHIKSTPEGRAMLKAKMEKGGAV
ncbi:MAG: hypothetical protein LUE91_05495 [Oscillospiraceae bacterium]|nr:hypothetical protein [Oscillospiraceae bacterium]